MFPERDIANEFWLFVRERAIDKRSSGLLERPDERNRALVLDTFEKRRVDVRKQFMDEEAIDREPYSVGNAIQSVCLVRVLGALL